MQGLALELGSVGGVRLLLTRVHTDMELDLQNTVVHVMTRKGSDRADPARGTDLTEDVVSGFITTLNGARHAANFAALETLRLMRAQTPPPLFADLILAPIRVDGFSLQIDMTVIDSVGTPVVFSTSFQ